MKGRYRDSYYYVHPTKTTPTMGAASVGRRASAEMARTTQAAQVGAGIGPNKQ